jgi:hypothetical protein
LDACVDLGKGFMGEYLCQSSESQVYVGKKCKQHFREMPKGFRQWATEEQRKE